MFTVPSASSPEVDPQADVKIIRLLNDEVPPVGHDTLARELEASLDQAGQRHLLLDFQNVQWITSAELGTLLLLHKRLAACGGRLTLVNVRQEIYEVFAVTRLHTLLEVGRMS